jgi:ribosomal peptide maturation radical SAM protein 1
MPQRKPRVALIYPPYGPPNLASLGLALLSAGLKARGFTCRTFYWNYLLLDALPHSTLADRRQAYSMLTERTLYPWTEWAFTRWLYPEALGRRDREVTQRLALLDATLGGQTGQFPPSRLVQHLLEATPRLVAEMTDHLAPFDIIGISSTFFQNGAALALAHAVKKRWPKKLTVLGGANCDGEMGRAQIELFPFLDVVFSGEVDHAFPNFVQRFAELGELEETAGALVRMPDGRIVEGPRAEPLTNLNELPLPDFDDYIAERRRFGLHTSDDLCLPLESSRGCWWGAKHHCVFCGLNANGMAFRQKDPDRFRHEAETIAGRYGARYLFMADNILSARYYRDFVQWAKGRHLNLDFFYEIKANVARAQVADLAEAGITMVQPGIESFSSATLRLMRKGVRGIQNIAFLKYAADYGLFAAYNLLAGFPGEDPLEYEQMARELPKLSHLRPPNGLSIVEFHRFSPYHNDPTQFDLRLRPHANYNFIYPFPEHELARLAYFFEMAGRAPQDLAYLAPIQRAIESWRKVYNDQTCTLTWHEEDEGSIVVEDHRPGFGQGEWHLRGQAADLFRALDTPTTPAAAIRVTLVGSGTTGSHLGAARTIDFAPGELATSPEACLRQFTAPGLAYEEDGLCVSLPIRSVHRQMESGWTRIGV